MIKMQIKLLHALRLNYKNTGLKCSVCSVLNNKHHIEMLFPLKVNQEKTRKIYCRNSIKTHDWCATYVPEEQNLSPLTCVSKWFVDAKQPENHPFPALSGQHLHNWAATALSHLLEDRNWTCCSLLCCSTIHLPRNDKLLQRFCIKNKSQQCFLELFLEGKCSVYFKKHMY